MDFNKLDNNLKEEIHFEILAFANAMGGKNFFLKMIEEIRAEKPNPLLNKTGTFHTSKAKITLSKSMYKDTFSVLFDAIRREDRSGDMLNGIAPKEYKATMNMMRALAKVTITAESKEETGGTYDFTILDTSEEKKTKVTFVFKAIFFYHLDEAKKALAFKSE
ncbi:hypothetical protein [Arcobacter sp. LA11]|uniref:hypothetical protein n=1 Tax=Arcobacter sp. LA11 TaxID=1898176 RepID=UPI0009351B56|nr:hypothetical protein [Arcobacter sp. LA11]